MYNIIHENIGGVISWDLWAEACRRDTGMRYRGEVNHGERRGKRCFMG